MNVKTVFWIYELTIEKRVFIQWCLVQAMIHMLAQLSMWELYQPLKEDFFKSNNFWWWSSEILLS